MKLFRRFKRVVKSNTLSTLEKMENPLKMIKLSINELGEANISLDEDLDYQKNKIKRLNEDLDDITLSIKKWEDRAALSIKDEKEDLARRAIAQKLALGKTKSILEDDKKNLQVIIDSLIEKKSLVEKRLFEMQAKEKYLSQKEAVLNQKKKIEEILERADIRDFDKKYAHLQRIIDLKEADLETTAKFNQSMSEEDRWKKMEEDKEIDEEIKKLKKSLK